MVAKKQTRSPRKSRRGRPRGSGQSKSARVRELLGDGLSAPQIAERIGCSTNLVYVVKSNAKSANKHSKRGQGGNPARASSTTNLDEAIAGLQAIANERDHLARTLERVKELLDGLV